MENTETHAATQAELQALVADAVELDGRAPADLTTTTETDESDGLPQAAPEKDRAAMLGLLATATTLLSKLVCPNWQLQPDEINDIATAGADCLDYYYPDLSIDHPLLALGLVTSAVALPRLAVGLPMREETPEPEAAPEDVASERAQKQTLTEDMPHDY